MTMFGSFACSVWRACAPRLATTMALGLFVLALAWPHLVNGQNRVVLPTATDLPMALAQAKALGQPLMVMVSLDHCPYCQQVRQSHLGPLWRSGQVVVQVNMQHSETLTDVDGQVRSHAEWVKSRKVSQAPTVLFLGPGGREVADRLEGASLPDFYGAYLDERLAQARQRLATQPAATLKPVSLSFDLTQSPCALARQGKSEAARNAFCGPITQQWFWLISI